MEKRDSISSDIDKQLIAWHEDPTAHRNLDIAIYMGSATVGATAAFVSHSIMAPTISDYNQAIDEYNQAVIDLAMERQRHADITAQSEGIMTTPSNNHELALHHHANSFSTDAVVGIYVALVTAIAAHQGIAYRLKNAKHTL